MKRIFISLLTLLALCSCTNNTQQTKKNIPTFHFNDISKPETIMLSEIGVNDIEYIPLETNDSSIISNIRKVKVSKNKIIVYDFKQLSMFNMDGSYITEIGKTGKGPEEYLMCNDFDFFIKEKSIVVLSKFEDKFYWYGYDGKFIKTTPAPKEITDFVCSDSTFICYCENLPINLDPENSFYIVNTDGDIIKQFSNKYKLKGAKNIWVFGSTENLFYRVKNQLYVKNVQCDTIFSWKDRSFYPQAIIDRGDRIVTPELRILKPHLGPKQEHCIYGNVLFAMNDFIYYSAVCEKIGYNVICTSQNGNPIVKYTNDAIVDDIDGGPKVDNFKLKLNDTEILSWINSMDLKIYVEPKIRK